MLAFYGDATGGLRVARKHLGWYVEARRRWPSFRTRGLTLTEPRAVARVLAARRSPNRGQAA